MRKYISIFIGLLLLVAAWTTFAPAKVSLPHHLLRLFLDEPHTWTGTQTFDGGANFKKLTVNQPTQSESGASLFIKADGATSSVTPFAVVDSLLASIIMCGGDGLCGIGAENPLSTPPNGWNTGNASNALQISSDSTSRDAGLLLRRSDDVSGLDIWLDSNNDRVFIDNIMNDVDATLQFRGRTLGTPISIMTLTNNGNVLINDSTESGATLFVMAENDASSSTPFVVANATGTSLFMVSGDGSVWAPSVYGNDLAGGTLRTLVINSGGQMGYDSSSIKGKTNITDINDTSWIYDLRPVDYEYKKRQTIFWNTTVSIPQGKWDEESGETVFTRTIQHSKKVYINESTGRGQTGLVAEEVALINPDFVFYDKSGVTPEGVHYNRLIVPMLKELQIQKARNDAFEARIATLEALHP